MFFCKHDARIHPVLQAAETAEQKSAAMLDATAEMQARVLELEEQIMQAWSEGDVYEALTLDAQKQQLIQEIETVKQCIDRGITPPVWSSANTPGGDEKNAAYLAKYRPRVKML